MLNPNRRHIFPAGHAPAGIYLPNTVGPAIVESLDVLRAIADCVPQGGRLLEFGTWTGAAAAWIADQRPDIAIVSADNFEFCPQNLFLWQCNQRPNMRLYVGQTMEFAALARSTHDVVLCDADHERPGIDSDLCAASDLIEVGGAIAVHDYGCNAWPGVKTAVDEFCEKHGWRIVQEIASLRVLRQ